MADKQQRPASSSGDDVSSNSVNASTPERIEKQASISENRFQPKENKSTTAKTRTFETADDFHYHKPIEQYEGLHRWDPDFYWEEAEEKKLVRKVSH